MTQWKLRQKSTLIYSPKNGRIRDVLDREGTRSGKSIFCITPYQTQTNIFFNMNANVSDKPLTRRRWSVQTTLFRSFHN